MPPPIHVMARLSKDFIVVVLLSSEFSGRAGKSQVTGAETGRGDPSNLGPLKFKLTVTLAFSKSRQLI